MILGRITPELIAGVPDEVREALGMMPDRVIAYEIDGGRVVMTRVDLVDDEVPGEQNLFLNNFSTFTEWTTDADCEAYANL